MFGPLERSVVGVSLFFAFAMAAAGDAPNWAFSPIVDLTPAEVYANWTGEFSPARLRGQPPPEPRDPASVPPRETALARALLEMLRQQARVEGQLTALRDISSGRIADLQNELLEARATATGAARGADLAAAIEIDRRASRGQPCRLPEPEPEPEGIVVAFPVGPPSGSVLSAVRSGRLGDLAEAMAADGADRRVRPRIDG